MPSIFGHALIGYAIGKNTKPENHRGDMLVNILFVALSTSQDLDYLPTWLFGLSIAPDCSRLLPIAPDWRRPALRKKVYAGMLAFAFLLSGYIGYGLQR